MALFTRDSIDRVREAADIVEVVSAHTDLRRVGQRFTGLCPFHDERTPSFSVDPSARLYHCFGCGVGGDVIKFVEEREGMAFADAVEMLADRYGVELEREDDDPAREQARRRRARLAELLDRTASFYVAALWDSDEARQARAYLLGRGLTEESLREFGVGYAPSAWDTVLVRGQKAGYTVAELEAAGLAKPGQKDRGHYDHFRARIMFPIRDARGRMQGFGGRALRGDQKAKYVNSPEGELFHKSTLLYAIDRARPAIAKAGRVIVVEGYTDVIACHQAGIGEVVAVMGTAITTEQVGVLAQHSSEVVLALDADRAGRAAMLRAQRVAAGKRVRLRVAAMPAGEDPAEMLAGARPGAVAVDRFTALVDAAVDVPVFEVHTILDEADLTDPAGRDGALDAIVPVLAAMPDSITRDELIREIADRLDADPALVSRRIASGPRRGQGDDAGTRARPSRSQDPGPAAAEPRAPSALSAHERQERALLAMCIADPVHGRSYLERLTPEHFSSPVTARARDWLLDHLEDPLAGAPRDDGALTSVLSALAMEAEVEPARPEAMELSLLQLEKSATERQIAVAQASGGDPPVELQRRRAELAERIATEQRIEPRRVP